MSILENRTHIPMPEVTKSREQIEAEAVTAREKEPVDSTVARAALETDSVQAREAAMTKHAAEKAKANALADGGAVAQKAKEKPGVIKTAVTYGVAGGVAGYGVFSKVLGPAVEWGGDKLKSAWQWLDVWDLSGSKAAKKEKPKK